MADKTKRGRKQDRRQANRRQKHELDYRAKKWRCSKLEVVLADMCEEFDARVVGLHRRLFEATGEPRVWPVASKADVWIDYARATVRRANREAKRPRGKGK